MTSPTELPMLERALAGQYELERELGRGGMGVVYLARDLKLQRLVAIKVLPPALAAQPAVRERFLREARIAAQLNHPNIVPVHRADELDGVAFFVMGFVDGESLGERVRREGPLAPTEVARVVREVALALGYAHGRGVVHRDVKPENILLERETGRAMVTDFGVARLIEASPLTSVGLVLGTVHYMSPEQAASESVDGRSDLFSLGVVSYYALSGTLPFDGPTAASVIVAVATRTAPPLLAAAPTVPGTLAAIVDRCLAKRADERWASGEALVRAIDEARDEIVAPAAAGSTDGAMISEADAEWLWRRAAELQRRARDGDAGTSTAGRDPTSLPAPPETTPYGGYRVRDVLASAVEADISRVYAARALEELRAGRQGRELATGGATVEDRTVRNPLTGGPMTIELESILPGEIPPDAFEELVDTIRRALGEMGQVATLGHSLTWSVDAQQRKVHVMVVPRGGRTSIRITERLGPLTGGIFGGIMGGVGGGLGGPLTGLAGSVFHSAPAALASFVGVVGGSYLIARGVYATVTRRRAQKLRTLLDALTARSAEAIATRAGRALSADERALLPRRP